MSISRTRPAHPIHPRGARACGKHDAGVLLRSPPSAATGNAPHSELPPRFDGLEYIAVIVRELVSAVRFQKLRAQVLRQHHPVRPTCAHALSWSWRSAANTASRKLLVAREDTQF